MLKTGWRAARPGQCLPPAAPSWENPPDLRQPSRHPEKKASSRPTASGWVPRGPQWLLLLGETAPGRASVGASGYVSKSPTSGLSPCPCQLLPQHIPAWPTAAQTQGGGANTGWPGPQFEIAATKPLFCLQCSPAHLAPSGCLDPVFKRLCREPEPSRSPAETQVHGRACVHTPPALQEATAGHPRLQSSPAPTRAPPPSPTSTSAFAVTKSHTLGGLEQQPFTLSQFGDQKSEIEVTAGPCSLSQLRGTEHSTSNGLS